MKKLTNNNCQKGLEESREAKLEGKSELSKQTLRPLSESSTSTQL